MKAVIELDVPEYQIGQLVTVYFKDTMCKKGTCEAAGTRTTAKRRISPGGVRCGHCDRLLRYDSVFCDKCGKAVLRE